MKGDLSDFVSRLWSTLPTRWFPDDTPVLSALLAGLSSAWSNLYTALASVQQQTRIATVTGDLLDGVSVDFFGTRLLRRPNEPDGVFRSRVQAALLREHGTRAALSAALASATGYMPKIFEPSRVTDTGAYNSGDLGYSVAGAWGSLNLPYQVFVVARRPTGSGIANIAGYGTAGPLARADLSQITGQVTDADILDAVNGVMPTASTAWIYITN